MSKGGKPRPADGDYGDITVLGKVAEPPPPEPPVAELIARFQLDTETLIAGIRRNHQVQLVEQERKLAHLTDSCERVTAEFRAMRERIEAAVHQMNEAVREAITAQRSTIEHAKKAADAAAVFDKLKASQPDFHRMVRELEVKLAKVVDQQTHAAELTTGLTRRLDDFEVVADDYEETKGQVRGIDTIVKGLNASDQARRRTEIRG